MNIVFQERDWKMYFAVTVSKFVMWMKSLAKQADLKRYRKQVRSPKKPWPKRKFSAR
jgi:hypothetical protein